VLVTGCKEACRVRVHLDQIGTREGWIQFYTIIGVNVGAGIVVVAKVPVQTTLIAVSEEPLDIAGDVGGLTWMLDGCLPWGDKP